MSEEAQETISVSTLMKQTMWHLQGRYKEHHLKKDIWRSVVVCDACHVSIGDSEKEYLVMRSHHPFEKEPVQRISIFPIRAGEVKWGWASDGYGSVPLDSCILIATPEDGLLFTGSVLQIDTARIVSQALVKMLANPLSAYPHTHGSIGGLFSFRKASYRVTAPIFLADAIEEVLKSESDWRWVR